MRLTIANDWKREFTAASILVYERGYSCDGCVTGDSMNESSRREPGQRCREKVRPGSGREPSRAMQCMACIPVHQAFRFTPPFSNG
jgi:hypothetical protein